MTIYADVLIAFWDGKSKGTKNIIQLAEQRHLKTRIILFENKRIPSTKTRYSFFAF